MERKLSGNVYEEKAISSDLLLANTCLIKKKGHLKMYRSGFSRRQIDFLYLR